MLKEKYALAKAMGERVNSARGKIEYHKKSIEAIRRERAMEREGLVGGGGDDGADAAEGQEESDEEREHKAAIEGEKATYNVTFAALRELKKEIEHIQRLLEKGRAKLQADFDQWYDAVLRLEQAAPPARGAVGDAARRDAPRAARAGASYGAGDGAGGGARAGLLTGNKDADDDVRASSRPRTAAAAPAAAGRVLEARRAAAAIQTRAPATSTRRRGDLGFWIPHAALRLSLESELAACIEGAHLKTHPATRPPMTAQRDSPPRKKREPWHRRSTQSLHAGSWQPGMKKEPAHAASTDQSLRVTKRPEPPSRARFRPSRHARRCFSVASVLGCSVPSAARRPSSASRSSGSAASNSS